MDTTVVAALLGTCLGGAVTFLLNWQLHRHQLALLREQDKTEYRAEETALHYLRHKGYTDRSFETMRKHLGGFEDDELRTLLVRAEGDSDNPG